MSSHERERHAGTALPPTVSLVLGGGGGRAIAHIGAWRALSELGVRACRVVGSSGGALIGACIAAGMTWQELLDRARTLPRRSLFSLDPRVVFHGMRSPSLFREEPLRELIRRLLPVARFDELKIPLSINAVDLATGRVTWFGEGGRVVPLADAVYASCALPLLFPAAAIGDDRFIDGGIVDPLPIHRARTLGEESIVAVDLVSDDEVSSARCGLLDSYARMLTLFRALSVPGPECEVAGDVIHIRPILPARSTFDARRADELSGAGYRASLDVLRELRPSDTTMRPPSPRADGRLRVWVAGLSAAFDHRAQREPVTLR